jgi:hypothetical protein
MEDYKESIVNLETIDPGELITIELTPKTEELFRTLHECNIHSFNLQILSKELNIPTKQLKKRVKKLKEKGFIKVIDKIGSFYIIQLPIGEEKSFLVSNLKQEVV